MSYEDRKALKEMKKNEGLFGLVPKIPGIGMDESSAMDAPKMEAPAAPKEESM